MDFLEFKLWKLVVVAVLAFFYGWWRKWHRQDGDDQ